MIQPSQSDQSLRPEESHPNRFLAALRDAERSPLVIAHRGASALAPENTSVAARLAASLGADAWELDVRLTRDGVPVVIHDATLSRTTDVARRYQDDARGRNGFLVGEFDWDEIRRLDSGSWFVSVPGLPRSANWFGTRESLSDQAVAEFISGCVGVPTLGECLRLTREYDWLVNVELKPSAPEEERLLRAVEAEVERSGIADRVVVSSFDHSLVAQAARSTLGWATAVLADSPIVDLEHYVREVVGADSYHVSAESLGLTAGDRPRWGDGVPVLCYTVNDWRPGGAAERLARAGVRGLFTDFPAEMLWFLGRGGPGTDRG